MDGRTRPQVSHNLLGKPLREDAPRLTTATWKTTAFGSGFPQLRSRYDDESFLFEKNPKRGLTAYRGTDLAPIPIDSAKKRAAGYPAARVESTSIVSERLLHSEQCPGP